MSGMRSGISWKILRQVLLARVGLMVGWRAAGIGGREPCRGAIIGG